MSIESQLFALRWRNIWVSRETFTTMVLKGWVIDARAGGLVVGRSHQEGNIYMIQQEADHFVSREHLEGGEYIVNALATSRFRERLEAINQDCAPADNAERLRGAQRTLNTAASPFDKVLLIDARGQFVVTRNATIRHFEELDHMNEVENDFLHCDLTLLVPRG